MSTTMFLKYLKPIIYISSIIIFLSNCEKVIDIDIPERDRKIVINGFINPYSLFSVNISKSLNILDVTEVKFLNDVTVNVYENNQFIDTLNYIGKVSSNHAYFSCTISCSWLPADEYLLSILSSKH